MWQRRRRRWASAPVRQCARERARPDDRRRVPAHHRRLLRHLLARARVAPPPAARRVPHRCARVVAGLSAAPGGARLRPLVIWPLSSGTLYRRRAYDSDRLARCPHAVLWSAPRPDSLVSWIAARRISDKQRSSGVFPSCAISPHRSPSGSAPTDCLRDCHFPLPSAVCRRAEGDTGPHRPTVGAGPRRCGTSASADEHAYLG